MMALSAMLFVSCSGEDSAPVDNNPPIDTNSGTLKEIREMNHYNGSYLDVHEYSNGKVIKTTATVGGSNVVNEITYTYNENNVLTSKHKAFTSGQSETDTYTYDSQGRMTHKTYSRNGSPFEETAYTYNGNIITGTQWYVYAPEDIITKEFHVDENGMVFKMVNVTPDTATPSPTYDIFYDGLNISSVMGANAQGMGFVYENDYDMSLLNLNYGNGAYKPNAILKNFDVRSLEQPENATKYIKTVNYLEYGIVMEYIYTFNEDGLPLTRKAYRDGVLSKEAEFIYE